MHKLGVCLDRWGGVCGVWVVEVRVGCACWWFGVTDGDGGVGVGGDVMGFGCTYRCGEMTDRGG